MGYIPPPPSRPASKLSCSSSLGWKGIKWVDRLFDWIFREPKVGFTEIEHKHRRWAGGDAPPSECWK